MNKLIYLIVLIILSWILQFTGIWWLFILPAIGLSWVFNLKRPILYFLWAFVGIFLLWTLQALVIDVQNDRILSQRMGTLLGGIGGYGIMIVTGLYGGLIAGLAAMLSAQIRNNYFIKTKNTLEEYINLKDIQELDGNDTKKDFI